MENAGPTPPLRLSGLEGRAGRGAAPFVAFRSASGRSITHTTPSGGKRQSMSALGRPRSISLLPRPLRDGGVTFGPLRSAQISETRAASSVQVSDPAAVGRQGAVFGGVDAKLMQHDAERDHLSRRERHLRTFDLQPIDAVGGERRKLPPGGFAEIGARPVARQKENRASR